MSALRNSWSLLRASWNVLRLDSELVFFPLMSGVASMLVLATFVVPIVVAEGWSVVGGFGSGYASWVVAFLFYLTNYFVIFFFNSALVGAALIRMDGGDPTVGDGLRIAFGRLGAILSYAAISATVGMILKVIARRSGFLGKLVTGFLGVAWTFATFLAVPVLVTRNVSGLDAVKQSAQLFRSTWGEQVTAHLGFGWAGTVLTLAWTLISAGALALGIWLASPSVIVVALITAVTGYIVLTLVLSALSGIYNAALFRYATTGDPGLFDEGLVRGAFGAR